MYLLRSVTVVFISLRKYNSTYIEQVSDLPSSTILNLTYPKLLRKSYLELQIIYTNLPEKNSINSKMLNICSHHATYAFLSESILYSSLNVKELLARSRREIWSLSGCNWTRTHNLLVHKRTLNHLAKLALNNWAVLWVLICKVHSTVSSYHVPHAFQSESTLNCHNYRWRKTEIITFLST